MGITNFQGSGTFIVGNKKPIYETEKGLLISDLSVPINYNFKPTENGLQSEVHWMKLLGFGSFAESMQKADVGDLVYASGVITYESYEKKGEVVLKTVMKVNSFSIVKAKHRDDEEKEPEKPKKKLVSNRR